MPVSINILVLQKKQTSLCSVENFHLLRFRSNEGFSFQGHISFRPTLDQQRTCANCSQSVLDGDFTVRYDVKRTAPDDLQVDLTAGNFELLNTLARIIKVREQQGPAVP